MENETIPVLIVGGGPAGLTAALLLAQAGITVQLIERHAGTSIHPRARGLNVRTMEIYRGLGLEDNIREAGSALARSRYMLFVDTLAGEEIRRVPDDDLVVLGDQLAQITPCGWCQCAQDELEPILAEAARKSGADLHFNCELISLSQDTDGVTAVLTDRATNTQRTMRAQYVIAADGAASPIRHKLGITQSEGRTMGYYVNIYFRADLTDLVRDRWFGLCFVENAASPGMFLAVNNTDRWLFNAEYDPANGTTPENFTPERCIDLVRTAIGLPEIDVEIISVLPWEAAARIADQFQKDRVFLIGDAAHVMPPAGGFGLNTGVQDAHNLAWKLAAVITGKANAALLDTYPAERVPVAQQVVGQAVRELEAPTPDTPPGRPGSDETPGGDEWPGGEPDLRDQLIPVLGYRYQSQAIITPHNDERSDEASNSAAQPDGLDLSGQPGTRAPHVWLERNGERLSTLDLVRDHFVLLVGSEGGIWRTAAHLAADDLKIAVDVYSIGAAGDLQNADHDWSTAYGVTESGAVLIRPDGFVCWRAIDDQGMNAETAQTQIGQTVAVILARRG